MPTSNHPYTNTNTHTRTRVNTVRVASMITLTQHWSHAATVLALKQSVKMSRSEPRGNTSNITHTHTGPVILWTCLHGLAAPQHVEPANRASPLSKGHSGVCVSVLVFVCLILSEQPCDQISSLVLTTVYTNIFNNTPIGQWELPFLSASFPVDPHLSSPPRALCPSKMLSSCYPATLIFPIHFFTFIFFLLHSFHFPFDTFITYIFKNIHKYLANRGWICYGFPEEQQLSKAS